MTRQQPPEHDEGCRTFFWEHLGHRAVRRGPWKLVALGRDAPWELYDLDGDPTELRDVARIEAERTERLRGVYEEWTREVGVVSSAELEAHRLPSPPNE